MWTALEDHIRHLGLWKWAKRPAKLRQSSQGILYLGYWAPVASERCNLYQTGTGFDNTSMVLEWLYTDKNTLYISSLLHCFTMFYHVLQYFTLFYFCLSSCSPCVLSLTRHVWPLIAPPVASRDYFSHYYTWDLQDFNMFNQWRAISFFLFFAAVFFWGGSWFYAFMFLCFSASLLALLLCFSCFSCFSAFLLFAFPASLLSLLLCFCTSVPFYFYYSTFFSSVMCFCCSTSGSFASLLPVFTVSLFFIFFCFILFCLYPKWNPRETLGESQRNLKEILIRNPTWSPKWALKKP